MNKRVKNLKYDILTLYQNVQIGCTEYYYLQLVINGKQNLKFKVNFNTDCFF